MKSNVISTSWIVKSLVNQQYPTKNKIGNENEEHALRGVIGPLVDELKLLRESMNEKYTKLDEKYSKLESVINTQKSDVTTEIAKLEQSIATQKVEIANEIMDKLDSNTKKLDRFME